MRPCSAPLTALKETGFQITSVETNKWKIIRDIADSIALPQLREAQILLEGNCRAIPQKINS